MKSQIEISYSFGYVFDKSKLIVMYPVGTNLIDKEEYEMEVEVAFLEDGVEVAFEEEDIIKANEFIKPLKTYLLNPSKVIPFVTSIKDMEFMTEINGELNRFDEEYGIKESYLKKGYEFKDVYEVFENIGKYIPNEDISTLNILKISKDEFDAKSLINESQNNLSEVIDENEVIINLKSTEISNRLFIRTQDESNIKYVRFAILDNDKIICANKEIINDISVDMGDLEINQVRDIGYIIEESNDEVMIKVANFDVTPNNQIVQILDYSGVFKPIMIDFIKKFEIN